MQGSFFSNLWKWGWFLFWSDQFSIGCIKLFNLLGQETFHKVYWFIKLLCQQFKDLPSKGSSVFCWCCHSVLISLPLWPSLCCYQRKQILLLLSLVIACLADKRIIQLRSKLPWKVVLNLLFQVLVSDGPFLKKWNFISCNRALINRLAAHCLTLACWESEQVDVLTYIAKIPP